MLIYKRSNKKQSSGRIVSNFTKEETFGALGGNLKIWASFFRKSFPLPFILFKSRIYLDTELKARLTDSFLKLAGGSLFLGVGIG